MGQTTAGKERRAKERNEQVSAVTSAANQAMNTQIAAGNQMYGGAVSTAVNEKLVDMNLMKVGNYFEQQGGEFIRLSKEEYTKKKKAGATNLSTSYHGGTTAKEIKYGKSNQAMGSGDPSGAMTSTPISQKMLQKQNKIKGALVGALSLAVPVGGNIMRLDAAKSFKDAVTPEKAHAEYMGQFEAKQTGKKPPKKSNIITDTLGGINKLKATLGGN